jgi:hypothetical protein
MLQRYRIVADDEYHRVLPAAGAFPFQRLTEKIEGPTLDNWGAPLKYSANYEDDAGDDKPAIRVADDGSMAIQDATVAGNKLALEPKTFYATPDLIAGSNRQLATVGSIVHLGLTGKQLSIPVDPRQPAGPRQRLHGVEPRKPPDGPGALPADFSIAVNECSQVAAQLMGERSAERGVAIFEGTGGRETAPLDVANPLSGQGQAQMAAYAAQSGAGATPQGMTGHLAQATADDSVDPEALKAYTALFEHAHRTQQIKEPVDPEVINRMSKRSTPGVARDELVKRIMRGEQFERGPAEFLIDGYREFATASSYGRELRTGGSALPLGINAAAQPLVGEAFFATSIGTPHVQIQGGAQFDFTNASNADADEFYRRVLDDQQKLVDYIKKIVDRGLTSLTRNVWTWHAATVVARSGGDSVTLENYNRGTTASQILDRFWKDFSRRHADAADIINQQLKAQGASSAPSRDRLTRAIQAVQNSVREFAWIELQLVDNLQAVAAAERWYFQMYGQGAQSFHEVWAPTGFVQPLTLRVGATIPADEPFLERVAVALEVERRAQIPQALKDDADQRPRWEYSERQRQRLAPFVAQMQQARSKSEVAQLAERARNALIAEKLAWKPAASMTL